MVEFKTQSYRFIQLLLLISLTTQGVLSSKLNNIDIDFKYLSNQKLLELTVNVGIQIVGEASGLHHLFFYKGKLKGETKTHQSSFFGFVCLALTSCISLK